MEFDGSALRIIVEEEDSAKRWNFEFQSVASFRVTSEELSGHIVAGHALHGGFFEVSDSPWLSELGQEEITYLNEAKHHVICCYDVVVEVVSSQQSVRPV